MDGWFRVAWKLKDCTECSSAVAAGVWIHLLCRVYHRAKVLSNGMRIERGECLISETGLADDLDVSRKVMRRLLKAYESAGMIKILKRDRNGTRLSVCQWGTYQISKEPKGHKRNSNEQPTEQQRETNERQSNSPNIPNNPESKNGGAAPRFTPPTVEEVRGYCKQRGNSVDPERFVDYYQAQGWKLANGRQMKDWKAAVRSTWEKGNSVARANSASDPRGNLALLDRLLEDETE